MHLLSVLQEHIVVGSESLLVYFQVHILAVKEIRKLKSQDSRTSECLRFTGLNRISLVRQKNLKREIRWNHFDHNKQMMQVYISIFIL